MLPGLKNLEVINFGDCLVKTAGAKALAQALQKGVPNLKELNLSFDEIDAEGALAISEASQNKDFLEKLDLNGELLTLPFFLFMSALFLGQLTGVSTYVFLGIASPHDASEDMEYKQTHI